MLSTDEIDFRIISEDNEKPVITECTEISS